MELNDDYQKRVEKYKVNYDNCVALGLRPEDSTERARILDLVERGTPEGIDRLDIFESYCRRIEVRNDD